MPVTLRPERPRLAVRAIIVQNGRVLLVNAYPDGASTLMCAPGGGVEPHSSLPENLKREVFEETGLKIDVGPLCLVNEFHAPERGFHQVELFFRCQIKAGTIDPHWTDPEAVVTASRAYLEANTPLQCTATADTVAEAILYFIRGADIVTGETLILDGGHHLQQMPLARR